MEAFLKSAKRPSRSTWTLEEAARFATLKEGYLLQFLSTHKGALATARRLGHPLFQSQPQSPSVAEGGTGGSGKAQHGGVNDASAAPPRANANRHRGAQRHVAHPDGQPQTPAPAPASSSVPAVERVWPARRPSQLGQHRRASPFLEAERWWRDTQGARRQVRLAHRNRTSSHRWPLLIARAWAVLGGRLARLPQLHAT